MTAVRRAAPLAGGLARSALAAAAVGLTALTGAAAAQTRTPAVSQTTTTTAGSGVKFGQPGQPIDISSKSTQVFQAEQKVIYIGEVEAIQGTTRLRTPQLTLWYNNNNAVKTPGAAPAPPRNSSSPSGAINRMEAEGPVYYVTATQSAKGDHGSYNAADNTIILTGNVILTQDKNVSTGDKLVIHQDVNTADLTSEKATGRVRGVFYNEKKDDGTKPAAAATAPAPTPKAR